MGVHIVRLPDVGEGVAEAELTEWHVAVGDVVREDDVLAVVMTDKASIEVPSSVEGTVTWLGGEVGDTIAIGAPIVRLDVPGAGNASVEDGEPDAAHVDAEDEADGAAADGKAGPDKTAPGKIAAEKGPATAVASVPEREDVELGERNGDARERAVAPSARRRPAGQPVNEKPLAAPSVRKRAQDAGIDLRHVVGSGPAGRITHDDLDAHRAQGSLAARPAGRQRDASVKEIKVTGLRRRIAERMAIANASIPHITIVEEVDVTNLEDLRAELNVNYADRRPKLTLLPFVMKAIVEAVREHPEVNAHFDDEAGVIHEHGGVHVGIATQTPGGLMVPVVRHAEANSLWDDAAEIDRLAEGARGGSLARDDLVGSTITITSLGPLGAIATTPIINHPEVAIVGINKIAIRPWWDGQQFAPRKMMNISCSFDHRVIDGWNAAVFVRKLKTLLEKPAMLFVGS